ncbi:MAG: tetratricopeptide repeat-containing protein [Desulfovibrio sp.]|jgi:hypothetical protein|nr:tetratricopeptide repeat-containing protein [Desulfovibrio sp.]
MKILPSVFLVLMLPVSDFIAPSAAPAAETAYRPAPPVIGGPDISEKFLDQARAYRAKGRYELARQSYAQALSTCRSNEGMAVIRHEMGGVELLLRTMR